VSTHIATTTTDAPEEQQAMESDPIEGSLEQHPEHIVPNFSPPPANAVNHKLDSQNTVSLSNVIDVVASLANVVTYEPIITPIEAPNVDSMRADSNITVDHTLQKDIDFMQAWLGKAAVNEEVPFSPVITKSQKKKLSKQTREQNKVTYPTRSQGPLPSSQ